MKDREPRGRPSGSKWIWLWLLPVPLLLAYMLYSGRWVESGGIVLLAAFVAPFYVSGRISLESAHLERLGTHLARSRQARAGRLRGRVPRAHKQAAKAPRGRASNLAHLRRHVRTPWPRTSWLSDALEVWAGCPPLLLVAGIGIWLLTKGDYVAGGLALVLGFGLPLLVVVLCRREPPLLRRLRKRRARLSSSASPHSSVGCRLHQARGGPHAQQERHP